jgi:hypothetical protein
VGRSFSADEKEMRVRSSVSMYGALDKVPRLPKIFPENDVPLLVLVAELVDLRKNLRQDTPLLVLENTLRLDGKAGNFEERCLKNLGRVGMQPTMMVIAISARLGSCQ